MSDTYHLSKQGETLGPFTLTQLQNMWRSGLVTSDSYYWKEGFAEWQPITSIIELLEPKQKEFSILRLPSAFNPRKAIVSYCLPAGRIGRFMFFIRTLAHCFSFVMLTILVVKTEQNNMLENLWCGFAIIIFVYLTIITTGKRLHDINISAIFSFLIFIPFFTPIVFSLLLLWSGLDGRNKYGEKP